jgi:hypothetical protein
VGALGQATLPTEGSTRAIPLVAGTPLPTGAGSATILA